MKYSDLNSVKYIDAQTQTYTKLQTAKAVLTFALSVLCSAVCSGINIKKMFNLLSINNSAAVTYSYVKKIMSTFSISSIVSTVFVASSYTKITAALIATSTATMICSYVCKIYNSLNTSASSTLSSFFIYKMFNSILVATQTTMTNAFNMYSILYKTINITSNTTVTSSFVYKMFNSLGVLSTTSVTSFYIKKILSNISTTSTATVNNAFNVYTILYKSLAITTAANLTSQFVTKIYSVATVVANSINTISLTYLNYIGASIASSSSVSCNVSMLIFMSTLNQYVYINNTLYSSLEQYSYAELSGGILSSTVLILSLTSPTLASAVINCTTTLLLTVTTKIILSLNTVANSTSSAVFVCKKFINTTIQATSTVINNSAYLVFLSTLNTYKYCESFTYDDMQAKTYLEIQNKLYSLGKLTAQMTFIIKLNLNITSVSDIISSMICKISKTLNINLSCSVIFTPIIKVFKTLQINATTFITSTAKAFIAIDFKGYSSSVINAVYEIVQDIYSVEIKISLNAYNKIICYKEYLFNSDITKQATETIKERTNYNFIFDLQNMFQENIKYFTGGESIVSIIETLNEKIYFQILKTNEVNA